MEKSFILGAQLSTSHSGKESLNYRNVKTKVQNITQILPLKFLIVGAYEEVELFNLLTSRLDRPTEQVFLWFNVLSDYENIKKSEAIIDYKGVQHAEGWSGWKDPKDVTETFQFGCVNRPDTQKKVLAHLDRLLASYPNFDGVFIDKFRFPSPAMGLDSLFSCFCPYCYKAADKVGLNLDDVRKAFHNPQTQIISEMLKIPGGAPWLEALVKLNPILSKFIKFRADSISKFVKSIYNLLNQHKKALVYDILSPGLAPLVGQDYSTLSQYAEWGKSITYRMAKAPGSLRLEILKLVDQLSTYLNRSNESCLEWLKTVIPEFKGTTIDYIDQYGVPLKVMERELNNAVSLFKPKPIYMGLEVVSYPGVINIKPQNVRDMMKIGLKAGVSGAVLSWDLMHTKLENIRAIKEELIEFKEMT
jgi:hypothetical protein